MKKFSVLGALLGALVFYACKKEDKTITVTNTVNDTINQTIWLNGQVDANTLTAAVTVGYASKVTDSILPAASTNADAPVLDTMYQRTYSVVKGQYLTIYPPNLSGYVAGYYVQIVGANSYFKVDYPAANTDRKAARAAARAKLAASNGKKATQMPVFTRGSGEGYIDSAIVIKLPLTISGDTFYVKYAAYDTLNRVSKPITATVIVLPQGDAAFNELLAGTWNYISYRNYSLDNTTEDWTTDTVYNYNYGYYTCSNNTLSQSGTETDLSIPYNVNHYTWTYNFGSYTFVSAYTNYYGSLDIANSTCSNYVYTTSSNYGGSDDGTFSYDPTTHRLMLIYTQNSNLDLNYDIYYVSELTAHKLVLTYSDGENSDDQYLYMYQFTK